LNFPQRRREGSRRKKMLPLMPMWWWHAGIQTVLYLQRLLGGKTGIGRNFLNAAPCFSELVTISIYRSYL
jgi:hypothetical protein